MTGPIDVARAAWGAAIPDWVLALAQECERASQSQVAKRIGRSTTLVSQVLHSKYPGDLEAVQELFDGAYRSVVTDCPELGTLPANECREWREKSRKFVNINSLRVRMYRACSACPKARKETQDDKA